MIEHERVRMPGQRRFPRPPRLMWVLVIWATLIGGIQVYTWQAMLTPGELLDQLMLACRMPLAGPFLLLGVMLFSPLLLIPAALLGAIAGLCFGPVAGVLYTLVGCNLSALFTFTLGRLSRQEDGRIARLCVRYGPFLRRRPFLSVLMLRLSFLPYEPVNYLAGLLHLRVGPFVIANTLGSLPGVILIVLAGSAAGDLGRGLPMIHPLWLVGALFLLAASIALAFVLRQRKGLSQ
jgi:uncharacterized membrane protein YdjX (TVP38/TMEM64 family)